MAFNIAQVIKDKNHKVFIVTTTRKKEEEGVFEYEDLKLYKIYSNYHERWSAYVSLYNFLVVKKVRRILAEIKPDIVHAHNIHYHLSYYSLVIARKYAKGVFLTVHDAMSFAYGKVLNEAKVSSWELLRFAKFRFNPFRNIFIKIILNKYVDKIFAVSESLKMALVNNKIKNIEVIRNGISTSNWSATPSEIKDFRDSLGISLNMRIILFGGRLSGKKGGGAVIDALNIIVRKVPQSVLLIVGIKNEYTDKMIRYAKDLGLSKNVIFAGWISRYQMKLVYSISDVVTVASLYLDPFPTINLEAMASAKPVVGTIFGGTKEVVENEKTGYIIDPNDKEKFAEKITELLLNEQKSKRFGLAGRKRVGKFFTEDAQIKKILFWYDKTYDQNN